MWIPRPGIVSRFWPFEKRGQIWLILFTQEKLRLGLPKGSLNRKGRGETQKLFLDAGYDIRGYSPGEEKEQEMEIRGETDIELFLCRPQSAPVELGLGLLDAAITGSDWIAEQENGIPIELVGDLGYGKVRLVLAVPESCPAGSLDEFFGSLKQRPVVCFSEYVNIARNCFRKNPVYRNVYGDMEPIVEFRGFIYGNNPGVRIFQSDGITEGFIRKGADIILENTQTGNGLKKYGLRELEQVMESSAGLYIGPGCFGWKQKRVMDIYRRLGTGK